jgi:DNA polymerase elongation subunit (family B)
MYQNIYIDVDVPSEYAPTVYVWDDKLGVRKFSYSEFSYAYKPDPSGEYVSLFGQRLKKVYRFNTEKELDLCESDLPKETRVLTDLYLDSDEPSEGHKVVIIDIEVDSVGGLPSVENADKTITSIALKDRATNEEYVFILDEEGLLEEDNCTYDGVVVFSCRTEEELLSSFLDTWETISPTIVTGWNISQFDIPYLWKRLSVVFGDDEANRLSSIGKVKFHERRRQYVIAGMSILDYLDLYKKFTYTEQPNYRLDTIAKIELGEGKLSYTGSLDELRLRDPKKYLAYNLQDERLVDRLDQKLKLIELVRGLCTIGHIPYEEYAWSSRWIEGALVTALHRKGIISPNKDPQAKEVMKQREEADEEGFTGAFVKAPAPGLYHWVFSLDLQSLYPSIVMSLNISPETKVGFVRNWNVERHLKQSIKEYIVEDLLGKRAVLTAKEFDSFMDEGKFTIASNGVLYRNDKVGILKEILDRWFQQRLEFKQRVKEAIKAQKTDEQEYWDRRQHIQKIFLNSLYGVLGLPIFRFYDIDNALAVTATGQDIIKTSAKLVNSTFAAQNDDDKKDYCIYIDTDSLYFSALDWKSSASTSNYLTLTISLAKQIEQKLNAFYTPMARKMFYVRGGHRFVIKGETIAESAIWVQKKRYALKKVYDLDTNQPVDKLIIKGLDVVRSSFPVAFRSFMREVIADILNGMSKEEVDRKILEFRKKLI